MATMLRRNRHPTTAQEVHPLVDDPVDDEVIVRATEVPMALVRHSLGVLTLDDALAPIARKSALSDLAVAATLAWGALESGALPARANLAELPDAVFARTSEEELRGVLDQGRGLRLRCLETIAARHRRM